MIALIIIAYVANIFLARYLNYLAFKRSNYPIAPAMWFLPIIGVIILFVFSLENSWFIGKHWKR